MIGLLLIILLILCIYIAKNLLENDPKPLNGRYSVPGRWYELKKITFIILYHIFRWTNWKDNHEFALGRKNLVMRRRGEEEIYIGTGGLESRELQSLLGSNLEQMEYLPNLLNHPQATDAVHFMGFSETDKTLFMLSIGQRPKGLCEIWLFLRVDGIGIFESPVQLDALVSAESEKCWRGGGLKLECLESHRRWHISFNGLLRKPHKWNEEGEELLHVKFGFMYANWSAFSSVFDFKNDIHPCALAQGFANEKWNRQFAVNLAMFQQQLSHYEQWGQFVGDLEIEGHEKKELPLRGPKSRLSGIWNWSVIYRYVAFIVHFETGISVHLLCISFQNSITHMNIGYVTFPNGKKAGISWSDASLADIADDGIIENIYQIKFTSDGKHYNLTVKVDKSVCPVQDTGLDWEGKIYNYTADYRLNVITRGSGLIQLYYLNESGRQVPDLVPVERFQEPVVPACSKLVLAFSDEACQCAKVVGGKGAQLAQLTKMQKRFECQFSVPKGLCVTIEALKFQMRVDNSLQEAVAELNNVACTIKKGNLQELCNRCIELFRGTKLAPEIESAIRDQLAELKLLGTEERLAIRSSAVGEDTEDSSAAGQLSTELGLKGFDQVCDAVRKCWASLYSFQAVQYRRQRGQPVPSNMGVVIQQMVAAQTAGVMFTCDPLTGHPGRLIINANYGLGESVVSGSVMPDTIILSHSHNGSCQIIKKETGSKKQQVVQALEGGVVYENTITSQTMQCCISEESILRLGQVALQIQKFLGNSKDIEWAIKDTHIYLLQARPVTTLDAPSEFELMHEFDSPFPTDYAWITNTNVGEVFPGAATPLTLSTFVKAIDYAFLKVMDHFGSIDQLFPFAPTLHMNFCGHLFFNLLFIYKGKEMNFCGGKQELDLSIQGNIIKEITMEEVTSIFGKTPWWEKIKNTIMHLKFIQCQHSSEMSFIKKLETYQISPASTAKGFYINIDRELPEFYKAWVASVILTTGSATWSHIVMNIFKQGKFTLTPKMSSDIAVLFSSCPSILSADIPTFLEAISKHIKVRGEAEDFLKMDAQTAASWLLSQQSGESGKKFQSFLQKHGYRCLREAELHVKSWEAEPTKLIPVIKATLRNNNPDTKKADKISEEAIASIKSSLSKFQRFILHFALPSARKWIIHREFGKAGAIKMTDIFKRAYWKLATLMVQEGFLPDEDLIFFLTHMEIGKLLLHRSPALISRAQRRRRLLEKQMLLKFKGLNNGKPVPIDNSSKATNTTTGLKLTGMIVSQGIVKGTARVVETILELDCIQQGDILITTCTDIGWSPYFPLIEGLITEMGGMISHGAVVAREYGIPCIVSCANATSLLRSGDIVILNAEKGFVEKVGESGSTDSV